MEVWAFSCSDLAACVCVLVHWSKPVPWGVPRPDHTSWSWMLKCWIMPQESHCYCFAWQWHIHCALLRGTVLLSDHRYDWTLIMTVGILSSPLSVCPLSIGNLGNFHNGPSWQVDKSHAKNTHEPSPQHIDNGTVLLPWMLALGLSVLIQRTIITHSVKTSPPWVH